MSETYCIKCNSVPCYISLMGTIECSNKKCQHYSEDLYPDKAGDPKAETKQDEDPQKSLFFWSVYHTDCGD